MVKINSTNEEGTVNIHLHVGLRSGQALSIAAKSVLLLLACAVFGLRNLTEFGLSVYSAAFLALSVLATALFAFISEGNQHYWVLPLFLSVANFDISFVSIFTQIDGIGQIKGLVWNELALYASMFAAAFALSFVVMKALKPPKNIRAQFSDKGDFGNSNACQANRKPIIIILLALAFLLRFVLGANTIIYQAIFIFTCTCAAILWKGDRNCHKPYWLPAFLVCAGNAAIGALKINGGGMDMQSALYLNIFNAAIYTMMFLITVLCTEMITKAAGQSPVRGK